MIPVKDPTELNTIGFPILNPWKTAAFDGLYELNTLEATDGIQPFPVTARVKPVTAKEVIIEPPGVVDRLKVVVVKFVADT